MTTPETADPGEATAPYPGLRPFEPHEWTIFFGRERMILDVIGRMGAQNLVFVHGGSGCGKSSLVRAGLLPMLRNDHELAGRRFEHRIVRPLEGPLSSLAACLADVLGPPRCAVEAAADGNEPDAAKTWHQRLLFAADIVAEIEAAAAAKGIQSFCLVIDQFEEAFHWARDHGPADVQVMVDLMYKVAAGGEGRHFFILATMRSDYIGDCAQFAGLASVINDCQYFLPALSEVGLLRCIVEPAKMFGGEVDDALADRLRFAASAQPDSLPALQHLLMRMTPPEPKAGGWTMTRVDFDAVGGEWALSRHADQVFEELVFQEERDRSPAVADGMARMFRALIDVDPAGRGVRRPCELGNLVTISGLERDVIERIVARFAAARTNLLVCSESKSDGKAEIRVDISHEALLRNWGRMTGWLRDEVDDGLRWRALAVTARTEHAVLGGPTLRDNNRWYRDFEQYPERARRYLIEPEGKARVEDEAEWIAVAKLFARSRRRRRWIRAGMVAAALLFFGLLGFVGQNLRSTVSQQVEELNLYEASETAEQQRQTTQQGEVDAATRNLLEVAQDSSQDLPPDVRRAIAELAAAAQNSQTGWVWIGPAANSNLNDSDGRRARPASIQSGQTYTARANLTLREGPPNESNASAPTVALVSVGARLRALAAPQAAPRDQYWLRVAIVPTGPATQTQARIYPQFAVRNPMGDTLRRQLIQDRYAVERAEILPQAAGLNEVRYCHESDAARAQALSASVQRYLRRPIAVQKLSRCPSTPQGTLELWVGEP